MKNILIRLAAVMAMAAIVLGTSSCNKRPINGDLDGQWQLMTADYPDGKQVTPDRQLYFCFFLHTANLRGSGSYTANMVYVKDSYITLEFPYTDDASKLKPYMISPDDCTTPPSSAHNPESKGVMVRLDIVSLSSSRLMMRTATGTVLSLRKF